MTTLYKPVLIETAEQAEALPEGTIAILRDGTRIRQTLTRTDSLLGPWEMDMRGYRHALVIGFTALVPVEAEAEWTAMGEDSDGDPWIAHVGHGGIDGTREEAEAYIRRFGGLIAHRALTLWEEA